MEREECSPTTLYRFENPKKCPLLILDHRLEVGERQKEGGGREGEGGKGEREREGMGAA